MVELFYAIVYTNQNEGSIYCCSKSSSASIPAKARIAIIQKVLAPPGKGLVCLLSLSANVASLLFLDKV